MSQDQSARVADAVYAVPLFVVAGMVLTEAGRLAPAPFDPLGPKTFPVWIAYGLIGLSPHAGAAPSPGATSAGRSRACVVASVIIGSSSESSRSSSYWLGSASASTPWPRNQYRETYKRLDLFPGVWEPFRNVGAGPAPTNA